MHFCGMPHDILFLLVLTMTDARMALWMVRFQLRRLKVPMVGHGEAGNQSCED